MRAVRAFYHKMVDEQANPFFTRVVCFYAVEVLVDVQFSVSMLACYVDFQNDIFGGTSSRLY
jgi:hypothetical protein